MFNETEQAAMKTGASELEQFPPLESVTRPAVPTRQAAYYLMRAPQTLRTWACFGGPINPIRIGKRLAWPTAEIRRLLGA